MRKKLKEMEAKLQGVIKVNKIIFVIILFTMSCNKSTYTDEKSIVITQTMIDEIYKKEASFNTADYLMVKKDFQSLYSNMNSDSIKKTIKKHKNIIPFELYSKMLNNAEFSLLSVKLIELYCLENIQITYNAKFIKPISIPTNNRIKLGETYRSEIYLSSLKSIDKPSYYAEFDNKKLKFNEDGVIPLFEIKPNSRGRQEYNLKVCVDWNGKKEYPLKVVFYVD